MSYIEAASGGVELFNKVVDAVKGAVGAVEEIQGSAIRIKRAAAAEALSDQNEFAVRETIIAKAIDAVHEIAPGCNILIVADYGRDKKHFKGEWKTQPNIELELPNGQVALYRLYMFNSGKYDRPMGPIWEANYIQYRGANRGEVKKETPVGCMYLTFPDGDGLDPSAEDIEEEADDGEPIPPEGDGQGEGEQPTQEEQPAEETEQPAEEAEQPAEEAEQPAEEAEQPAEEAEQPAEEAEQPAEEGAEEEQ
ncbi:hypothetical protein QBC36DRAFT_348070 [Triangularia setosa]|uniref:Uncharacterized protein n=1 Tax=Triangularia setosa TaxID=2587417 RepID=A0AAN6W649_9PEZI|nr:hypothetical protein QBC36DRAFT_348070 [Podospora setosa]